MPYGNNDWLALTDEPTLEPEIPSCDAHHHCWGFRRDRVSCHRYLRDEPCGELTCTVSELMPVDKESSGYRRQLVWRDTTELRLWKVEYYDRKDAHLKTLTIGQYQQYLDRYWRAGEMTMVNHLTGKSTVLNWDDYQFGTSLTERDFSKTGLKRAR